ncbi:MAG: hypothetical protein DYG88_13600 [Chloroflexi bacterium CFX4]|nr:hypothetical protein [Chloroflexi bacterium CFX4]MDL1923567.1 hypothetical protein [Chloroflexi bacterium CFX3]
MVRLRFWAGWAWQTLAQRRLAPLVRLRAAPSLISGAAHLPSVGTFVLALNHYKGAPTLDVIAVVLAAAEQTRPDCANDWLVIAGKRDNPRHRLLSAAMQHIFARWERHVLHIAWRNGSPSLRGLRAWRARCLRQASLVFPEGRTALHFESVREGSGRWLARLPVPSLPTAVWRTDQSWHVRFGAPLVWSARADLHDLQLSLNMARLLPPELAPSWQADLAAWHAAHTSPEVVVH